MFELTLTRYFKKSKVHFRTNVRDTLVWANENVAAPLGIILSEDHSPIGSAEELQIALDKTIERLRRITEELVTLEAVARDVVKAWQGQGNLDLARLARCLFGKDKETNREKEGAALAS